MKYLEVLKKKYNSWRELEAEIEKLSTTKLMGDAFEQFCYLYFVIKSCQYQINQVYLIKDIPHDLRVKYKLESSDCGVDGLIVTNDGKAIAYQCKFRSNRAIPSYDELSKFWVEGIHCDYRCTFANCSHITALAQKQENLFNILANDLDSLNEEFFNEFYSLVNHQTVYKQKYGPRKYQKKIIDDVVKGLQIEDRGKIIAACGTGKTLTALWITEKLDCQTVLFLAPSITLVKQTLESWSEQASKSFSYICVCSDSSVVDGVEDNADITIQDLGVPVTTNQDDITTFLKAESSGNKYVFSTYQSTDKIVNALSGLGIILDLIICDEAHRTAGLGGCFNLALDDAYIPSKKRIFMTATERLVKPVLARQAEESGQIVFSMDDETKYGPLLSRYNFGDAINDKTISDYKIVIAGVKETDVYNYIVENALLSFDGLDKRQKYEAAQSLYSKILLAKSMNEYALKKTITFHSSIPRAKEFIYGVDGKMDLNGFYKLIHSEVNGLFVGHVNGKQSAGERAAIMTEFKNSELGVVSNSKCLTEGVDVPIIDSVFFADKKKSLVDIVQACGRALRTKIGVEKTAYFIVPILIPEEGDPTNIFNQEEFDNVYNIIQALRDQDARLADWVNLLNRRHVQGQKHNAEDEEGPVIVNVEGIDINRFKDELYTKVATVNKIQDFGERTTFEYTRWSRTAGQPRIFKTFGDYSINAAKDSIYATICKLKESGLQRVESDVIKIDHNNIANSKRLGFIEQVGRLYQLSPLGRDYISGKVSFDAIIQRQLLRYSTSLETGAKSLFPYRAFLEILLRLEGRKSINFFEFAFCIYPIVDSTIESIQVAIDDIKYARQKYPNWVDININNREALLKEVNGYYTTTLSELDLWGSRPTTIKNQFGYFANHLGYLSDYIIVEGRGSNKAIKLKDGCETRLRKVLDETRDIEDHSKEQLLAKYTEAFFLLTIFLL